MGVTLDLLQGIPKKTPLGATGFEPVTSSLRVKDTITLRAKLSYLVSRIKV